MQFIFPVHGDVLHNTVDGCAKDGKLYCRVQVQAAPGRSITVNDVPMRESGGHYEGVVALDGTFNRLEACDTAGGERKTITVYWLPGADRGSYFTIDDFIRALEDIHLNRDRYTSIFDNPYMAMLRDLHQTYGTFVHINMFYRSKTGFTLGQMTDRFKAEFSAQADWLIFTFHAIEEHPDLPYKDTPYARVEQDFRLVTREIARFAGPALLGATTTLHWGTSNVQGARALRALGMRALGVYLQLDEAGAPFVSHYLSRPQVEHATRRNFWRDVDEDILFTKLDIVLDHVPADKIAARMDNILRDNPVKQAFITTLVHEQYFYPDYSHYEPDYRERLFNAADWLEKQGYTPMRLADVIRETP